jgi:alanine racemase
MIGRQKGGNISMRSIYEKWVEINVDKIAHNVREIRKRLSKNTLFIAVVKSNAYGYGIKEVSQIAAENGADWLGVLTPFEGEYLRTSGFKLPIFVISPFLDQIEEKAKTVVKNDLIQGIDSIEQAQALNKFSKKYNKITAVHVKIDTGLSRFGVLPENVIKFVKKLSDMKNLKVEGIYTHFASSYAAGDHIYYEYNRFKEVKKMIEKEKICVRFFHCANSAAAMDFPWMHMDAVRIGFSLFHSHISREKANQWDLKNCLRFKTRVVGIREVDKGICVGYDNKFVSDRKMKIAVLPVGYNDGIPTGLANKGKVLIKGQEFPLIGSICMNHVFVDVTDSSEKISIGDKVTIIGRDKDKELTYRDIAAEVNAGGAETVIRILQAVPKFFYKNNKRVKISNENNRI